MTVGTSMAPRSQTSALLLTVCFPALIVAQVVAMEMPWTQMFSVTSVHLGPCGNDRRVCSRPLQATRMLAADNKQSLPSHTCGPQQLTV